MNNLVVRRSDLPPTEKIDLDHMDSRTGFGEMIHHHQREAILFIEKKPIGRSIMISNIIIITLLGKTVTAGTHSKSGMEAYQGGIHTVSVGIVMILLCVTNITSKIHLNNVA